MSLMNALQPHLRRCVSTILSKVSPSLIRSSPQSRSPPSYSLDRSLTKNCLFESVVQFKLSGVAIFYYNRPGSRSSAHSEWPMEEEGEGVIGQIQLARTRRGLANSGPLFWSVTRRYCSLGPNPKHEGASINDICKMFGFFDPLPPLSAFETDW